MFPERSRIRQAEGGRIGYQEGGITEQNKLDQIAFRLARQSNPKGRLTEQEIKKQKQL